MKQSQVSSLDKLSSFDNKEKVENRLGHDDGIFNQIDRPKEAPISYEHLQSQETIDNQAFQEKEGLESDKKYLIDNSKLSNSGKNKAITENVKKTSEKNLTVRSTTRDQFSESETVQQIRDSMTFAVEKAIEVKESVQQRAVTIASNFVGRLSESFTRSKTSEICTKIIKKEKEIVENIVSSEAQKSTQEKAGQIFCAAKENALCLWQSTRKNLETVSNIVKETPIAQKIKLASTRLVDTVKDSANTVITSEARQSISDSIKDHTEIVKEVFSSTFEAVKGKLESELPASISPQITNPEDNLTERNYESYGGRNTKTSVKPSEKEKISFKVESDEEEDFGAYSK